MYRRELPSLAAFATLALAAGVGCPEEDKGPPTGPSSRPSTRATTASTAAATGTGAATGKPATTGEAAAPSGATGTVKGVVNFAGKAPEMKVPAKRKDAEFC